MQGLKSLFLVLAVATLATTATSATMLPPRLSPAESVIRVYEGQTNVVLECLVDVGDDPIEFRWIKNHLWVTGTLGHAYRGYRTLFLALHPIRPEHSGKYICQGKNEAGVHAAEINVIVGIDLSGNSTFKEVPGPLPRTNEVLAEFSASLSDVLAESDCRCDLLFLLHASQDAPHDLVSVQANLINTVAENIISEDIRVSIMTYSDYLQVKLPFGNGTNSCALRKAFHDLNHQMWSTKLHTVLREVFKKFKKSSSSCKVLVLPIIGSSGPDGIDMLGAQSLKKMGVKVFVLEVTDSPVKDLAKMASHRGDGKPYHWRVPLPIWPSIVTYMQYMAEELEGCFSLPEDIPNQCVGEGVQCTDSDHCRGQGMGCIEGICQSLECNVDPSRPGCCTVPGRFWCGDVTRNCTSSVSFCDGRVHCMNGRDENTCWSRPCPANRVAQCESTTLCLSLGELCDGHHHCPAGEDEDNNFCKRFPCPPERPFRCRNGKCISTDKLCDGRFMDCEEGEDENLEYCFKSHRCTGARPFKCDYGVCIESSVVCDGTYNCLDGGDEKHCDTTSCPAGRPFKCNSGSCIKLDTVCNGLQDGCSDGSDELNCANFTCPPERSFKCMNGRCIDSWLKCNKGDDCGDGTDEVDCPYQPSYRTTTAKAPTSSTTRNTFQKVCAKEQFTCMSGACIHLDRVCDGRANCADGDDELDCENRPCPANRPFRCATSKSCVNAAICDDVPDCPDGSDEVDCDPTVSEYNYEAYDYDEMIEKHGVGGSGESQNELFVDSESDPEPEPTSVAEPEPSPGAEPEPSPGSEPEHSIAEDHELLPRINERTHHGRHGHGMDTPEDKENNARTFIEDEEDVIPPASSDLQEGSGSGRLLPPVLSLILVSILSRFYANIN